MTVGAMMRTVRRIGAVAAMAITVMLAAFTTAGETSV
jgi:hypothetical protein